MEEKEKQYRIFNSATISGLVSFMNKIGLPKEDFIMVQKVDDEYLMVYYR